MKVPLFSALSVRARVLVLMLLGLLLIVSSGTLYASSVYLTPPPPTYQAASTIPHTDVNPYAANFFLEREVEAWKRERTVQMARDAGIGWGRQEFIWAEIEPQKGVYNWDKYDDIVALFAKNNIRVIARLDRPPQWARTNASATGSSGPPDDFDDYGDFVRAFVQHYAGKVDYLQIWNEPNLGREWNDAPIDPAAYTRLLKIAYESAKAADPNVQILSAPLAITLGEPFSTGSTQFRNMNDLQFLEEMYKDGAKDYFDIASANAFGLGSTPDDPPNPGKLNFQRVLLEREVMEKFGDAQKAVWILEYGWNAAPDSIPDSLLIWGRVTEEQQAEYTVRGIELARNNWNWVGVVSIWFFRQVGDIPPNNPESFFRMVDVDFTPRPVYFAVSGATTSERVAGPGAYEETNPALTFKNGWKFLSDTKASGTRYAQGADGATATLQFYGQALDLVVQQQPGGGRLYLTVDGKPVDGLSKSETGQSFVAEDGDQAAWKTNVPVVRNLTRGQHTVELRGEGPVNLDGFVVPAIPPMQPPWVLIGVLGMLGIVALGLAIFQAKVGKAN